jgi:hypothetical protein
VAVARWVGANPASMRVTMERRTDDLKRRVAEALAKTADESAAMTQDILEAAVTKTGKARVASGLGRFPGRHATGNMVGSLSFTDLSDISLRSNELVAAYGWFSGEFEAYFRDQDLGEGNIPAARAMPQSFAQGKERLRGRLSDIVKGREAG